MKLERKDGKLWYSGDGYSWSEITDWGRYGKKLKLTLAGFGGRTTIDYDKNMSSILQTGANASYTSVERTINEIIASQSVNRRLDGQGNGFDYKYGEAQTPTQMPTYEEFAKHFASNAKIMAENEEMKADAEDWLIWKGSTKMDEKDGYYVKGMWHEAGAGADFVVTTTAWTSSSTYMPVDFEVTEIHLDLPFISVYPYEPGDVICMGLPDSGPYESQWFLVNEVSDVDDRINLTPMRRTGELGDSCWFTGEEMATMNVEKVPEEEHPQFKNNKRILYCEDQY